MFAVGYRDCRLPRQGGQGSLLFFYLLRGSKAMFTPLKALIFLASREKMATEPGCFFAREAALRNKKLDIRQEFLKV